MAWTWRYQNELGQAVELAGIEGLDEVFPSQSDAESWLGEVWRDLHAGGATEVVLLEDDRAEYTMPLTPPE
jgi:hypothetical protein